jgi:hypothetical protein
LLKVFKDDPGEAAHDYNPRILQRWKQKELMFKDSLGYIVSYRPTRVHSEILSQNQNQQIFKDNSNITKSQF